jgi:hypothetical protein
LNPFSSGGDGEYVDAASRLHAVKEFSAEDCRAALKLPDLQKTVRLAVERRLRKLEGVAASQRTVNDAVRKMRGA